VSVAGAVATLLLVPAVASMSVVVHELGPFDTPFQPRARTALIRRQMSRVPDLTRIERSRRGARYLLAAYPAGLASRFIFHGGHSALPIGGLSGAFPEPSLAKLRAKVANGEFHLVLAVPADDDRYAWIASRCSFRGRVEAAEVYYCRPEDAQ